jgi:hypothetical protein
MKADSELERWQSLWQTDVPVPHDLRERARRQIRRMRIMLAGDIAVTVIMGGGAAVWALNSDRPSVRLLVVWVWFTIAAAWIFRYFNNRDNWTGAAPSTDAFFEAWAKRCRETQRNLLFGIGLGMVQLVVCSAWVNRELHMRTGITLRQFVTLAPMTVVWLCAALLFVWAFWLSRKVRAEWIYVQRLKLDWENGEVASVHSPQESPKVKTKPRLLDSVVMFPTLFEGLDWQLRRRKRKRHGLPPM